MSNQETKMELPDPIDAAIDGAASGERKRRESVYGMSIDAGLDAPIRGGGSGAGSFRAKIKGPAEAAPTTWSKWARSKKWIVSHESVGYKIWWSYTLLCVFATLVTLPLQIAFFPNSPSLNATSWLMDSSFALDLLINFRLSFRDPETDGN